MSALGLRAVLACLDRDAASLAAATEQVGTWDDRPGVSPFPPGAPRYLAAVTHQHRLIESWRSAAARGGLTLDASSPLAGFSAGRLAHRLAPEPCRDGAQWLCSPAGQARLAADFAGTVGEFGPQVLVATAALAARHSSWLFATQHVVCLTLLEMVRAYEAAAAGTAPSQRNDMASEDEARACLEVLFPGDAALPGPGHLAPHEADIVALLRRHLTESRAAGTTPEQADRLRGWITSIREFQALQARTGKEYHTPLTSHPPR